MPYNDFGEWIDDPNDTPPDPDWFDANAPAAPISPTSPNTPLGMPGSGAYWTDAKGVHHQNDVTTPDTYKNYTYNPQTGELRKNSAGAQGAGDAAAIIREWQGSHSASEPLTGLIDELKRRGVSADAFMYGETPSGNEITLNGEKYKVKTGDNASWWDPSMGEGGGDSGSQGSQQQPFAYPSFDEKFSYPAFEAPTGITEQNDPGFKARLQAGQDALERSAAAKGTLLTGGTLRDQEQFAQDYASNEFGNVYNRAAQTYGTNYNAAANQYNTRLGAYQTNFGNALSTYGTNFGVDQALWNRAFSQNGQGFAQLYDLASLGLNAAGASNAASRSYVDAAGNLITGAGNANAAGQVGGANAYTNAFGNIANFLQYASMYRNRYTPSQPGVPG